MHQTTVIPLSALLRDPRVWPRRQLCKALVNELAEVYRHNGMVGIDPIVAARVGRAGCHLLIDGWHRVAAAELEGLPHLPVTFVDVNSDEQAYEMAVRLSSRGKTPMTRAEKQTAVDRLLTAHPDWSDLAVAQLAGVSNHLVATRRRLLSQPARERQERETRPRLDRHARSIMKGVEAMRALAEEGDFARQEDALASAALKECGPEARRDLTLLARWAEGAGTLVLLAADPGASGESEVEAVGIGDLQWPAGALEAVRS